MFDLNTLGDLSLLAESVEVECKLAQGQDGKGEVPKDFWPTYSAMANAHGGVVRLPFVGAVFGTHYEFFPDYTAGLYTLGRTSLVVSRGLGGSRRCRARNGAEQRHTRRFQAKSGSSADVASASSYEI